MLHSVYTKSSIYVNQVCVSSPGSNEIQEVLPAVTDFVEFMFNLSSFALVAGPGQTFSQLVQV